MRMAVLPLVSVSFVFILLVGDTFQANLLPTSGDLSPIDGALLFTGPDGPEGRIRRMRSKFPWNFLNLNENRSRRGPAEQYCAPRRKARELPQ